MTFAIKQILIFLKKVNLMKSILNIMISIIENQCFCVTLLEIFKTFLF